MAPKKKSKKPQESTRSTHDSRLGLSDRTVKRWAQPPRTEKRPENWLAQVIKAERCDSEEYKRWEWTTVFEIPGHDVLEPYNGADVSVTCADAKISLRLYDSSALIELFTHPIEKRGQPVAPGDFWAISLRGHNDYEKGQVGAMMRRVEYLAREMPDLWFSYRNFFTIPGFGTDTTLPPAPFASVGRYVHEMAGSNMTFAGNLARVDILEALGHRGYRPRLGESQMETRAMARQSNAYRYSTVLPAVKPPRKAKDKTPRLERLEARRAKRAGTEEVEEVEEEEEEEEAVEDAVEEAATSNPRLARFVHAVVIEQKKGIQAQQSEPPTALDESSESKGMPDREPTASLEEELRLLADPRYDV
ncbi:MAG: hypothetical protein Q9207_004161 [Kuettlingeria erythrocarpa]